MEIQPTVNADVSARAPARPTGPAPAAPAADRAAFDNLHALDRRLDRLPVLRPDAPARAQELFSSVEYPPAETIRRLANLLALHLDRPAEEAPPA